MTLAAEHDGGIQHQISHGLGDSRPAVGTDPDDRDGRCGWTGGVRHEAARYRLGRHEVP